MHEEIELDRLYISALRSPQQPLPWPTADELARAREIGLIEPVIVRPLPGTRPPNYDILFGLTRWLPRRRSPRKAIPVGYEGDENPDFAQRALEAGPDIVRVAPFRVDRRG